MLVVVGSVSDRCTVVLSLCSGMKSYSSVEVPILKEFLEKVSTMKFSLPAM